MQRKTDFTTIANNARMLHSRAIGIIINTSFQIGNWPYKASLRPFMSNFRLGNSHL